jgi:hypothetical protein
MWKIEFISLMQMSFKVGQKSISVHFRSHGEGKPEVVFIRSVRNLTEDCHLRSAGNKLYLSVSRKWLTKLMKVENFKFSVAFCGQTGSSIHLLS